MISKESNFISAVIYIHNDSDNVIGFLKKLNEMLEFHFLYYELIVVDDACTDDSSNVIKEWVCENSGYPITLVHMSKYHGREDAMNAGIDSAIGDYIYEFDTVSTNYDMNIAYEAYSKVLEGNDIVCVCPKNTKASSRLFYKVFNRNSNNIYKIRTDVFRIVTRRAINRVHASNQFMPYRKAAYAASGLKMISIVYDGMKSDIQVGRSSLAIDSLILYTNAGFKISMGISIFMMIVAVVELLYTIVIYCMGKSIEGWTTTMLVMTFGFLGMFILLSIVIRYLTLNLDMVFRRQKYLVESVEKISGERINK